MNFFKKWLRDGNDCSKCKAAWSSQNYCGEWDGGCLIEDTGVYEVSEPCRLPLFIRWLFLRKAKYLDYHKWDGYYDFVDEHDKKLSKCEEVIKEKFKNHVIYFKQTDGTLLERNTEWIIHNSLYDIVVACGDKDQKPQGIISRWKTLLIDTFMKIPNTLKPYIKNDYKT